MAFFPKVQSPCPYKSNLSAVMDGDFCRMCERQVFDITGWTDGERMAFLSACDEEVCVSYRLPLRAAARTAAFVAAAVAAPSLAAAQEPARVEVQAQAQEVSTDMIIVGGIKDPARVEFVAVAEDETAPELPVVYEDAPAPERPKTAQDHPAG